MRAVILANLLLHAATGLIHPRPNFHRNPSCRDAEPSPFDPRISPHLQGSSQSKVGVIVVDHGSKREAANKQLEEVARAVKARSGRRIVEPAHMEIAGPTLAEAYAKCVAQGATRIVCHPFFLSPGRHVMEDIPALLADAASHFPEVHVAAFFFFFWLSG